MSACLDGLVGVFCPEGVPNTDSPIYWLSELPGINLLNSVSIADHESVTGENLMNKSITFSKKLLTRDFIQRLRQNQLFLEVIGDEKIGRHGTDFLGVANQFTGIKLTLRDPEDRFIYGFVEYIELKVEADAAGTVIYYQLDNQPPVSTLTADLVQGYNKIELNLKFNEVIRIWIDNNAVSLSDGQQGLENVNYYSCVNDCLYDRCGDCMLFQSISAPVGPVGSITWTESNTYNGFVALVQCKSDPEEMVCIFREELATALLYRSGAYLMEEKLSSSRNNPYVRNTRDQAEELLSRWLGGRQPVTGFHIEGEYPRSLEQVVQNAVNYAKKSGSRAFKPTTMILGETVVPYRRIRGRSSIRKLKNI